MSIARSQRDQVGSVARYVLLVVGTVLFLTPFYLLVRNALSPEADITSPDWKVVPGHLQWSNFSELFDDESVPMFRSLVNSVVVAVAQTLGTVVICSMAGYGLARIPHRAAKAVFGLLLATLLIPAAVTFVPSFIVVSSLGWLDTYRGLIVPGLFQAVSAFLFRQAFLGFPSEIEDAARVDGLGYFGTFWRIVVPNSKPIFAAVGTLAFIASWNQFLWPLIIAQDPDSWTVQLSLSTFITAQSVNLHELFAAAIVSIVPLLVVFVALQRYIVQGVERTGVNG
ncbi:carbohydrate ABC transporter permease [Jatrophihabitans fulvus]